MGRQPHLAPGIKKLILCLPCLLLYVSAIAQPSEVAADSSGALFENSYIRISGLRLAEGDTMPYHKHELPAVFAVLSEARINSQIDGYEAVKQRYNPGDIWCNDFAREPMTHRLWNQGKEPFYFYYIEILGEPQGIASEVLKHPQLKPAFDNVRARAYHVRLAEGEKLVGMHQMPPMLLLVLTGEDGILVYGEDPEAAALVRAGAFSWIEPGSSLRLENHGREVMRVVLIEIK
jgi:quercetin dioxygenase-like cupin family protein